MTQTGSKGIKKMKKLIALLLILVMSLLTVVSCTPEEDKKVRIGFMAGPTGMGMAKLIHDNGGTEGNDKYEFVSYTDTALAKADLTKGDVDIICIPTNEALAYYNTADNNVRMLAVNCLNSLYVITNEKEAPLTLAELEGETIYTCKNGTPKIILEYIIQKLELNVTVSTNINGVDMNKPADVSAQVIAGSLPYAVIPEPIITSSILQNKDYQVAINLADEWAKIPGLDETPVAMGCVVTTQTFIDESENALSEFLTEYKASIEYISDAKNRETAANYVAEAKIMGAAPAAKKALINLGDAISYIDGSAMKTTLNTFYTAIGMKAPGDEFYYAK